MTNYLLGIDVGTTGSKVVLINSLGETIAAATTEYSMYMPKPLWAEQNPEDWWLATQASIRQVIENGKVAPGDIAGIGLTGQMHGLVLLDKEGSVLRPCIMWNDQRTAKQCQEITKQVGAEKVLQLIGNPVLPGFTAPKVIWVRENEPHIYEKVATILLPKDYIRYCLTGELFSEVSDSSGTAMFDVGKRQWSEDMLAALSIPREWMPEVTESPVVSARVNHQAAQATGLKAGTPVVGGGGDQAAQAVGTGIVKEGVTSVTLGTSGVVFAASDHYRVESQGRLHAFCHAVPGMWHLMGVMLSAAGSFRWYRDVLGDCERQRAEVEGRDPYDLLTEAAANVPPGSDGLIFLPYLTGERTPYPDPNARGVFFGFTLRHKKQHFTRCVLEGVGFGLRDSLGLMRNLGIKIDEVRLSGGGARSTLWRQILADILNSPTKLVNTTEGAAFGSALIAGVGAHVYDNMLDAANQVIKITESVEPSSDSKIYAAYYPHYQALYPALAGEFSALSKTEGLIDSNSN
jgi:xylulokinase